MKTMKISEALNEAISMEMERDNTVFYAGEDVGKIGGSFTISKGLLDKFGPERVLDTPISETAIIGLGIGAALVGMRPIVEIMFMDFIGVCMDEIMNQAAKMRYMFGGKAKVPMVITMSAGATVRGAAQHSQTLEAMLSHIPGLKVIYPSTANDMKGLMLTAIRDDNPVVFIQHKAMYSISGEVEEGDNAIPMGKAKVLREGDDVTILAWGWMAKEAIEAADELSTRGINAEIIDPRTLVPFDEETLFNSVKKTKKLVIAQEAVKRCGYASEIAAEAVEKCFFNLNAPIIRVAAPNCPVPYSPILEDAYVPCKIQIVEAVEFICK